MSTEPFDPYVIRTVRTASIDAPPKGCQPAPVTPARHDRRAALSFDGPIVAAEVLLGPAGCDGRHAVLAGADRLREARRAGRTVLLAAIVGSDAASRSVLARWHVHHAA